MLRRSPGFAIVAILTLALGIGANTTIFSVVNAVILQPFPFSDSQELVFVWGTDNNRKLTRATIPPGDFLDWRAQNHVFQGMAAYQTWFYSLTGAGEPEQLWGVRASANFLDLLRIKPVLGRTFLAEEEQPGHDQVVILSHGIWVRRFGSNPNLIGQSINIDGKPYTVVGVLPAGFNLFGISRQYDLWMPLAFAPDEIRRDNPSLIIFARLKDGVTVAQANAEMNTITKQLEQAYPETNRGVGANVVPLQVDLMRTLGDPLLVLLAAVGLVLLIACANVANLLLSRAAGRQREVAVRAALGAPRLRIVRQLLTESVLLGLLGGAVGLLLAYVGLRILPAVLPPAGGWGELPHTESMDINLPVLGFTVAIAILTGIIFGLAPAFQISKSELTESLKEGGRSSSGGLQSQFTRNLLVIAEVGLSIVLLVGAGTLIRGLHGLLTVNPGFNPKNLLSMQIWLPDSRYPNTARARLFFQELLERLRVLPGVKSASAINFLPLTGWTDFTDFDIEGKPVIPPRPQFVAHYRIIDPNYFQTLQIPLLRGRNFMEGDGELAQGVAIINQALAEQYWPSEDPLGKRIRVHIDASKAAPWRPASNNSWLTIVGIVGDVSEREWGDRKIGEIYLSYLQDPSRVMRLVLRTAGPPLALGPSVRHAVETVDKDQPVSDIKSMDQFLSEAVSSEELDTILLSFFAALAIILAAIGIYGVISYSVAQRTHEIGIRMALGAQPGDVVRLIVWQGMRMALIGVAFGVVAANVVTHLLSSLFFGIKSLDALSSGAAILLLMLVTYLACYLPARRATRVEPVQALRYE